MSRHNQLKEIEEKGFRESEKNNEKCTSARTRPFSYEEIMLRRKMKVSDKERNESILPKKENATAEKSGHMSETERPDELVFVQTSIQSPHVEGKSKKRDQISDTSKESRLDAKKSRETLAGKSENKTIAGRKKNDTQVTSDNRNGHSGKTSKSVSQKGRDSEVGRGEHGRKDREGKNDVDKPRKQVIKVKGTLMGNHLGVLEKSGRKESLKSSVGDKLGKRKQLRSPEHDGKARMVKSESFQDRKSKRDWSDPSRSRVSKNGSGSDFRKHGVSTSGLGGYSPRKRKTAAVSVTSPVKQPSEKRRPKWDLAPVGVGVTSDLVGSNLQIIGDGSVLSSSVKEVVSAINTSSANPLSFLPASILPMMKSVSLDSIQLTQATRPLRRLYLENLPSTVSEKDLMEWLNNLMISSRVNHVHGTEPCISCTVHKEKGQAVVELLTPEDASAALSFNGRLLSGTAICIRRPKDYVGVAINEEEKPVVPTVAVSDVVIDSPNKIFVGGIPKIISSEMFMEIAIAFGNLKAFQFHKSDDHEKQHAFLEYVDPFITLKACAGLSGMKLGCQTISAVKASQTSSSMEQSASSIPDLVKPLLESPTHVLLLKNVLTSETLLSLPSSEIDDILEDVKLECLRFGSVKKVTVVRQRPERCVEGELCSVVKGEEVEIVAGDGCRSESRSGESSFETGCVLVEFGRIEAACTAAHCLNGRSFDRRIVSVAYVSADKYFACFLN